MDCNNLIDSMLDSEATPTEIVAAGARHLQGTTMQV